MVAATAQGPPRHATAQLVNSSYFSLDAGSTTENGGGVEEMDLPSRRRKDRTGELFSILYNSKSSTTVTRHRARCVIVSR